MTAASPGGLTYARDRGSWHVHPVPADPAQPDGLRDRALCGLYRYSPRWVATGADLLRRRRMCARCAASVRRHGHPLPELPLFARRDRNRGGETDEGAGG